MERVSGHHQSVVSAIHLESIADNRSEPTQCLLPAGVRPERV